MIPETATEWYQFTCACCQATWTSQYEVRRVTDDACQVRAFLHESRPALRCPRPRAGSVPRLRARPGTGGIAQPSPGQGPSRTIRAPLQLPHHSAPHCYGSLDASRRFTFKAVVSLDRTGWHPQPPVAQYPEETRSPVVHVQAPAIPMTPAASCLPSSSGTTSSRSGRATATSS